MRDSKPTLKLLDVGAGSGTISATFAKEVPDGRVIATDVKEDILLRARAVAEEVGVHNIEFQQADVFKLPFADETFDVTHCHQVLCHLKEPWNALSEMLRVTKPGGVVAAREGDLESECVWPELPGLIKFHNLAAGFIKLAGGSPRAGRQLLSWALKAGAVRERITVSFGTWCYTTPNDKEIWGETSQMTLYTLVMTLWLTSSNTAQGIVNQIEVGRLRQVGIDTGLTTANDLDEMAKAWEEWKLSPEATLGMIHGEILIHK